MSLHDVAGEIEQRADLRLGKRFIAEFVARIDELDADRTAVDVALTRPIRDSRMPGAAFFRHVAIDAAVAIDRVMGGDFRLRIAEPRHRLFRRFHAGVVQHQHVDRHALGAFIVVGRAAFDDPGRHHQHHTKIL